MVILLTLASLFLFTPKKQDVLEPSPLLVELCLLCLATAKPRATFFVAVLKAASIATMRDTEQAHTTRKTEGRVWVPSTTGDKTCTQDTHQQHSTPRERERDRKTRDKSCTMTAHHSIRVWLNGVTTQVSIGLSQRWYCVTSSPHPGGLPMTSSPFAAVTCDAEDPNSVITAYEPAAFPLIRVHQ